MPLMLKPEMLLERSESEGYVSLTYRNGMGRSSPGPRSPEFRLHPFQGLVLSLFDGQRTKQDVVDIATAVFEHPREMTQHVIETVLDRYRQFMTEHDAPPRAVDSLVDSLAERGYDPRDFLFPTTYNFRKIREAAPQALMWIVTEYCNRKCRYCYKDARFIGRDNPTDMTLDFGRVEELAEESARIGVIRLILSGGEPFLRPDLIEIIGLFVARGIDVLPITKSRITGERMRALRDTGVAALHLSLDSHRRSTVDHLVDVPGAYDDMVQTLRAAKACGLPVVLRPVLTRYNVRDLESLIEFAYDLGVREFLTDIYGESCGRNEQTFELERADLEWLRAKSHDLARRFPDAKLRLKFEEPTERRDAGRGCVEGARGLTILPDGRVTKCEHWNLDQQLDFGDLKYQSIMEVWESDRLHEINCAPRERYAGSPCFRCKKFDACNEVRGRCTLSTLKECATLHGPDSHCPIGAFEPFRKKRVSHRLPVIH